MSPIDYQLFVRTIFESPNLELRIQHRIVQDLSDEEDRLGDCASHSRHLMRRANLKGYNIVTRFVPPYCSTVTFYKDTIGFVTVSRLGPDFDTTVSNIGGGYFVTHGALRTLEQGYHDTIDLNRAKSDASAGASFSYGRDKKAHENALQMPTLGFNQVYIRLEGACPLDLDGKALTYTSDEIETRACGPLLRRLTYWLRIGIHRLFMSSSVDFQKGPAAVINDFLYNTHSGKYAKELHINGGELSAHLNGVGKVCASLQLTATLGILAAVIALFANAKVGTTGLIIAGSVILGLYVWQILWTLLVASTTYEDIVSNDLRLRTTGQAAALFGLDRWLLKLLLAMISPHEEIRIHGIYNSYIDTAGMGSLDVSDPAPSELIYLSGYITSSLDPLETNPSETEPEDTDSDSSDPPRKQMLKRSSRAALAAWVPFDTHRITFQANDRVRRFWLIDGYLHFSRSERSSIEKNRRTLVFKHDGDALYMPKNLRIYQKAPDHVLIG